MPTLANPPTTCTSSRVRRPVCVSPCSSPIDKSTVSLLIDATAIDRSIDRSPFLLLELQDDILLAAQNQSRKTHRCPSDIETMIPIDRSRKPCLSAFRSATGDKRYHTPWSDFQKLDSSAAERVPVSKSVASVSSRCPRKRTIVSFLDHLHRVVTEL